MSPYAYLAAARVDAVMPQPVEWQPVLLGAIFKATGRSSWAVGDEERRRAGIAEIERRAAEYGLPPMRWPDPWPGNSLRAMRAAIHARREGREREFAMAAFAAAFAEGRDLTDVRQVLEAAERAGLDPAATERALDDEDVKHELRDASDQAHGRGVFGVPTVAVGDELFWGDDQLEEAAAAATRTQR